jgi:hypothetical protein
MRNNTAVAKTTEHSSSRIKLSAMEPKRAPKAKMELGVIDQIIAACKPGTRNRLALVVGLIAGGIVPIGSFLETHMELNLAEGWGLLSHVMTYAVLGGLTFSALTVYAWFKKAYGNGLKAFGVVVFLEVIMTTSHLLALSIAILTLLVFVNGFATACTLNGKTAK